MAGLRAGAGHEQVLPGPGPALPARLRRHLHAADELGRVRPLHQRCRGRRHERPGRPRVRLAPRVGRPTGARPRAVPRHHVLTYRAAPNRENWSQAWVAQNSRSTAAARAGSWSIHQWPSPSRAAVLALARAAALVDEAALM